MWNGAGRKILNIVLPNDDPGMFRNHPRQCHPRVTIRIHKVDSPANENVLIIRATGHENECTEERDLQRDAQPASAQTKRIGNRQSKMKLGPPGFEPGTKGL